MKARVRDVAETIVMIHGMWGGPWYWENYKTFLEERGYRCIAPFLRFHDVSPGAFPDLGLGNTSILDYASDLQATISELDAPPIIMGHSMGGLLAQILGSRGLAKALVLVTPAAPAGIFSIRPTVFKTFFRIMTKWGFWKRPTRLTFDEAVYSMLSLLSPQEQKAVYNRMVYESGRATGEIGFWFFDGHGATRVDESKIVCPVLVIGGLLDRITPVSVVRQVAKKYERVATYKEYPNHAHWMLSEPGWEEVPEYIDQWLKKALT